MTATNVRVQMQQRKDTAANWASANPTLLSGELGYETDTGKWKVGTGSAAWATLGYTAWSQISAYPLVNADVSATAEIAVSKLGNGTARQLLQTDGAGTGVEFASDIDVPGTLDVTGAATFDGNITVQGDLTVNGTTTTIDTTTLLVQDKNIELGVPTTGELSPPPSDSSADGGGITLKGTTDKTINWINSTDAWTLSEHLNIVSAKEFRIAGTKVLDATSLGIAVAGSSLTSVGTIATGVWNGTPIATAYIADDAVTADKLADTSVTAGSYTVSSITVDAQGRITAASSGTAATSDKIVEGNTEAEVVDTGSDGHFKVTTEGTERIRIGSSGEIGLAGTNYGTSGQVLTSGGSGAVPTWTTVSSSPDKITEGNTSAEVIDTGTDGRFVVTTEGTERLKIDSSGRVLVGTSTSPTAGNGQYANIVIQGYPNTSAGAGHISLQRGQAAFGANNQIGLINFGDNTGASYAGIECYADADSGANDFPGRLVFSTTADGASSPTERLRIDSSGKTTIQGVTVGLGGSAVSTNTAVGSDALAANTTGYDNEAAGFEALKLNTTGNRNTANGSYALKENTTGLLNTATGHNALLSNTTGQESTATGGNSLRTNTTGSQIVAIGYGALYFNTTGGYSVAAGYQSMHSNTTGSTNVAIGYQTLYDNTTGANNVGVGYRSLYENTTGQSNSAIGRYSLRYNTTGSDNAAIGINALNDNTTGQANCGLGPSALSACTSGSGNTAIGVLNSSGSNAPVFTVTTENNRFVAGHQSISNAYVKVAWTVTSDERDKMNFAPVPYGLDFVNKLKPTTYQFKVDRDTETPNGPVRYGFKAQDILALEGDNPVIIDTEDADNLKYKGEHLVPVLVNAVQELTVMVKELKAEVAALKGA